MLHGAAHLEGDAGAAVIDHHAVERALLHLLDLLGRRDADRRAAERRHEVADFRRSEAQPHALHVVDGLDRLLGGVDVARLMGEQRQHLHALVLGVEIFRAQFRIVQHLGADLGGADQIGHLHDAGQREAARRRAMQEPGNVGLAGAGEIVMLLHRTHLRAGKALHYDAAAGILLELVSPT